MDILERFGKRKRGGGGGLLIETLSVCLLSVFIEAIYMVFELFQLKTLIGNVILMTTTDLWNQSPWLINTCFCVLDNIAWIIQRYTSGIKLQGKNFLCYGNRKMFLSDITWERENCASVSHTFLKSTSLKSLMRTFGKLSNIVHMVKLKSFF